jgi:peptidoglycan/LPS O-acetylase OafA/YrhL
MLSEQLRQSAHPLNFIRLALAITVIIAHSSPIGGVCCEPTVPFNPTITLGTAAVGGFFALSGLLVTMSAMRQSGSSFLAARLRRIFPGLALVLVITTFALAPSIYLLMHKSLHGFSLIGESGALTYLFKHLFLGLAIQQNINGVFYPGAWINIALWSIPVEFRFYLVALALVVIGRSFGFARVAVFALVGSALLVGTLTIKVAFVTAVLPEYLPASVVTWLFPFLCGAVVGTNAHRIRLGHALGIGALATFALATVASGEIFKTVGYGSLTIVLPYLASLLPTRPFRWFANDLSYGAYLWGVPVQQTLAFAGLGALGLYPFMALSVLCTLPFAAVSWFLVERRFLKRRA